MISKNLDFLKECLSKQSAALLLGAGFSFGAKNAGGNELPLGGELAERLFDHFYVKWPTKMEEKYVEDVSGHKRDLRKICSILSSENRREIRDKYLTNLFSGCHPGGKQYLNKIKNYTWNTIFSLNIDDLVENIFSATNTPLCVWNYSQNGKRQYDTQTLIKLHGDIQSPEDGYVFDEEEYSRFTVENNCLLKEFAHIFTSRDMVILGSEFQESDIAFVVHLYEAIGYNNSDYHYFFVVPKINDIVLQNKIENTDNFHWIDMDTESFLTFVSQEVVRSENSRNLLKERGAIFIDEISPQENYTSHIYYGQPTQYNDFLDEWDIIYPGQMELINCTVKRHAPVTIITLFGKPYNGKTTVGKRCLVDLKNKGYIAIEIPRLGFDVYESLSQYLSVLPPNSQVALLIENAAYQYEQIVAFFIKHFDSVAHIVVITTDTLHNHAVRNHNLLDLPDQIEWHDFEISEKVTPEFAAKIFFRLCVKKRLNNYMKYCPPKTNPSDSKNMNRIWKEMEKTNDVIEVLYFSSEGKYFREYYADWINKHKNTFYDDYLYILVGLGKLGISDIPLYAFPQLVPNKASKFRAAEFLSCYTNLVEAKNGHIKLLRSRLISAVLQTNHDDRIKNSIHQLVKYTMGLFSEGDESEAYELFQKALRVKRITQHSLLSSEQMEDLFKSLEKHCANVSYFWVQYGLASQCIRKFEDANNHFLYAKNLRPNSYQVAHALAKNRLEIGLDDLGNGRSSADENFRQGCTEMENIIRNPSYDRAFGYSVHSYAVMLMRYYEKKEQIIPPEQCTVLNGFFNTLLEKRIDSNTKKIIVQFYRYCEFNNIMQYCEGLEGIWSITPYTIIDEDEDGTDF